VLVLAALKTGSFVTRERLRGYSALLLIAYAASLVALLVTADGILDWTGRPLGTDFANVYAAGKLAANGQAALAYDWPAHRAMQESVAGRTGVPYYGWHYPPMFLLVAAVLSVLPYLVALLLYQAATLSGFVLMMRSIAGSAERGMVVALSLAFPATFVNLTHGQNGFLTAALMGGAMLLLDRRPLVAGCLGGCLAYKPQFAALLPLVLVATGRWRVLGAAAATAAVLAAAAWVMFGSEVFAAFWRALPVAHAVAADGAPGFYKIQSVYAGLRLLGAPAPLADSVQLLVSLGVAGSLVVLWRSAAAFELKASGLLIGSLLATPYVLDYDWVVLAPAIALLAMHGRREGFTPYELTILAALWLLPLAARPLAFATCVAVGPMVLLGALVLVVHRAHVHTQQLQTVHPTASFVVPSPLAGEGQGGG
jgi:hypothetical protein